MLDTPHSLNCKKEFYLLRGRIHAGQYADGRESISQENRVFQANNFIFKVVDVTVTVRTSRSTNVCIIIIIIVVANTVAAHAAVTVGNTFIANVDDTCNTFYVHEKITICVPLIIQPQS